MIVFYFVCCCVMLYRGVRCGCAFYGELFCSVVCCVVLYCVVMCCVIMCDVAWCGVVLCDMTLYVVILLCAEGRCVMRLYAAGYVALCQEYS